MVERPAVRTQALPDDFRDALAHLLLEQQRSLRTGLADARRHVHWQSLVLRAGAWQPSQQSGWRNRPVLRAQNDMGRICQKKLRKSLATSVPRSLILSSPFPEAAQETGALPGDCSNALHQCQSSRITVGQIPLYNLV